VWFQVQNGNFQAGTDLLPVGSWLSDGVFCNVLQNLTH